MINTTLNIENDTDLVILLGDTVDPKYEESYTARFTSAVNELKKRSIPWVSSGGLDRPGNLVTREYMLQ